MRASLKNLHPKLRPPLRSLKALLVRWSKLLPVRLEELSVVFVEDDRMAALHGQTAGDASPTDILTFDYGSGCAEIFISLDTALLQAEDHGVSFEREVRLYLAHGLLHLSGYDDRTPSQRRRMRLAEQALLKHKKISPNGT